MNSQEIQLTCHLKAIRLARQMSQTQLAELIGVKRQAIYDIEIGKYTPNTALALRLARVLQCKIEDLFVEEGGSEEPVTVVDDAPADRTRVALARIRGKLLAYPLIGKGLLLEGFEPADGVMSEGAARLLCPPERLAQTLVLFGCDPAFSILGTHTMRHAPLMRVHCLFASSRQALHRLAAGHAHLAGTHMHNTPQGEGNLLLARDILGRNSAQVIAFSHIEEGLMVAPGNPLRIRSIADLGEGRVRLANREPGAALRGLLDAHLSRHGIPTEAVSGYDREVFTHHDSAVQVLFGQADVALGFRAIAASYGLDFVTVETVRCDLIVPRDLQNLPGLACLLDTLQTKKVREDLRSLPGYEVGDTGSIIAEL